MLSIVGPHRVRGSLYEQCGVHGGDNDLLPLDDLRAVTPHGQHRSSLQRSKLTRPYSSVKRLIERHLFRMGQGSTCTQGNEVTGN